MSDDFECARALFLEGMARFEQGDFAAAEERLQASLRHLPGRASTLLNLGVTRLRLGRPQAALEALDAALAVQPDDADAWGHRGMALAALGRFDDALAAFDQALARDAGAKSARYQRAMTLNALRRHGEALAAFDALLQADADQGLTWLQHARTLQCLGRHDEALPSYRRALALDPALGEGWSLLGQWLKDHGRAEEAATCFERALAQGADGELNRWFLAAVQGGRQAPARAPRGYVTALFDGYAAEFEPHLLQALGYRAPEMLGRMLAEVQPTPCEAALDLGCGTGLCAPVLRRHAAALDGVDLSTAMLEQARATGLYRHLHHGDLVPHLQGSAARYGLVMAADVFIYVGALDAVFAGVRRVLQPGGHFAFSVEAAPDGVDFELRQSLRYAHGMAGLRDLARRHGLVWAAQHEAPLRQDQGQPVAGLYVLLGAPPDAAHPGR